MPGRFGPSLVEPRGGRPGAAKHQRGQTVSLRGGDSTATGGERRSDAACALVLRPADRRFRFRPPRRHARHLRPPVQRRLHHGRHLRADRQTHARFVSVFDISLRVRCALFGVSKEIVRRFSIKSNMSRFLVDTLDTAQIFVSSS